MVHNETATGVTSDIGRIRETLDAASHPALLMVDGVSSVGALPFKFDDWKVDVAVTGSQKALSLPTGLGIVAASDKVHSGWCGVRHSGTSLSRCGTGCLRAGWLRLASRLRRSPASHWSRWMGRDEHPGAAHEPMHASPCGERATPPPPPFDPCTRRPWMPARVPS